MFHYVPLHSAPAGRKYGRTHGSLENTEQLADRLVRLPMWSDMTPAMVDQVVTLLTRFFGR